MGDDRFYLGAYWAARLEGGVQCARRVAAMMRGLRRCDDVFARWYYIGTSPRVPWMGEVPADEVFVEDVLEQGRSYRDDDGAPIPELGFSLSLRAEDAARDWVDLSLTCGLHTPGVPLANRCLLLLPARGDVVDRVLRVPLLTTIMEIVVGAFEPGWAIVDSLSLLATTSWRPLPDPRAGWLTYLPVPPERIPPVPPPARMIPCALRGAVIIATEERFSADNPAHVAARRRVDAALREGGLLWPP